MNQYIIKSVFTQVALVNVRIGHGAWLKSRTNYNVRGLRRAAWLNLRSKYNLRRLRRAAWLNLRKGKIGTAAGCEQYVQGGEQKSNINY